MTPECRKERFAREKISTEPFNHLFSSLFFTLFIVHSIVYILPYINSNLFNTPFRFSFVNVHLKWSGDHGRSHSYSGEVSWTNREFGFDFVYICEVRFILRKNVIEILLSRNSPKGHTQSCVSKFRMIFISANTCHFHIMFAFEISAYLCKIPIKILTHARSLRGRTGPNLPPPIEVY